MINSQIIAFAIEAHTNVNHLYDGKPYATHLAMVAHFAYEFQLVVGKQNLPTAIASCWLHDTIEDCRLTYNDISAVAGTTVADVVYAVSNEKGKTRADRANDLYYQGIRNTKLALFVKLCDRIANVQYSKETNSVKLQMYQQENSHFIAALFPNQQYLEYEPMVNYLKKLLEAEF